MLHSYSMLVMTIQCTFTTDQFCLYISLNLHILSPVTFDKVIPFFNLHPSPTHNGESHIWGWPIFHLSIFKWQCHTGFTELFWVDGEAWSVSRYRLIVPSTFILSLSMISTSGNIRK